MKKIIFIVLSVLLLGCDPVIDVEDIIEDVEIIEEIEDVTEIDLITRFVINKDSLFNAREGGTVVFLDYPILTRDGVEYDVNEVDSRSIEPVRVTETATERIITIDMNIETGTDSFLFHSGNMLVVFDFTLDELDVDNATILLEYLSHEDTPPTFDDVLFNLSSNVYTVGFLELTDNSYVINGHETLFIDADGVEIDMIKYIEVNLGVHNDSKFLFHSGNFERFFRFELTNMTRQELLNANDIVNRYPYEYLLDLVFEYDPTNPILDQYGYFD